MSTGTQTPPTTITVEVTPEERDLLTLFRSGNAPDSETVTVPIVFLQLLKAAREAARVAQAQAYYAANTLDYLIEVSQPTE